MEPNREGGADLVRAIACVMVICHHLLPRLDPAEHTSALILRQDQMTPALWQQLTPVAQLGKS